MSFRLAGGESPQLSPQFRTAGQTAAKRFNPHHPQDLNHHPLFLFPILLLGCPGAGEREDTGVISDFLALAWPWTKALHIMSVIAWMAGLFYLPRLFVYHAESVRKGSETDRLFQTMERKLLRLIMNPAMIATWIFGLMLVFTPGIVDWSSVWPWTKAAGVLAMSEFHHWLARRRKEFASGTNSRSGRSYRLMNEVPTVLMVVIVISVVLRF